MEKPLALQVRNLLSPRVVWVAMFICLLLFFFSGLEVTKQPTVEKVSLDTNHRPLFLSYCVCGSRHNLERFRFKLTVLQESIGGGDVKPTPNGPLVYDSTAAARGISASLWKMNSSDYEKCVEVMIRVWADHPKVQNATIELKLGIKIGRIPREYPGGTFELFSPEEVEAVSSTASPLTTESQYNRFIELGTSEKG